MKSDIPSVVCLIYRSTWKDVDGAGLGLEDELDGALPPGWTLQTDNGWVAVGNFDFAILRGPGAAWGAIRALSAADNAPDSYWLSFQLVFPQQ
jgi:hypothetical protein